MKLGLARMLSRKSSNEPLGHQIEALLKPIAGPNPAGRSVHYDNDYARISEARRAENAALPQGVWVRDVKRADWETAERLCVETLTARSKDIWVACWLTEAWTQRQGLPGLCRGLSLLAHLCELFWPNLHPAIEPGDLSARVAPFEWLNQRFPVLLNLLPLVSEAAQPDRYYSWSTLVGAQRLEHVRLQDPAGAQRAEAKGAITLAQFLAREQQTGSPILAAIVTAGSLARRRLDSLDAILTVACGRDAPGFGRVRTVLSDIQGYAEGVLRARAKSDPEVPLSVAAAALTATPPDVQALAVPGLTRRAAFQTLARVAEFLAESEPLSPVHLVLRELVAWEALSLPELQSRLQTSGSDVAALLHVLGLLDEMAPKDFEQLDSGPDTF